MGALEGLAMSKTGHLIPWFRDVISCHSRGQKGKRGTYANMDGSGIKVFKIS